MSEIAGIILAAGMSSRMKGTNKLLVELNGKPLLQHAVDNALGSSLGEIVVVLGNGYEHIVEVIDFKGSTVVFNPDFASGQSASLKSGIAAVGAACEAVLFMLGDQPLVDPRIIDAIVERFEEAQAPIVAPVFCGRLGNPVLFGRSLFQRILAIEGDTGARALLKTHNESISKVEVGHNGIHLDVDTWEDYADLPRNVVSEYGNMGRIHHYGCNPEFPSSH